MIEDHCQPQEWQVRNRPEEECPGSSICSASGETDSKPEQTPAEHQSRHEIYAARNTHERGDEARGHESCGVGDRLACRPASVRLDDRKYRETRLRVIVTKHPRNG